MSLQEKLKIATKNHKKAKFSYVKDGKVYLGLIGFKIGDTNKLEVTLKESNGFEAFGKMKRQLRREFKIAKQIYKETMKDE